MFLKKKKKKRNLEIIFLTQPNSFYAEAYRKVPINLEFSNLDRKIQIIHLTSAVPGENKTTTAINLAAAYAELNKNVLIIDLDLRRPKVHRYFNLPNDSGLTNYLVDQLDFKDLINRTDYGIDVINSGPEVPAPHVILRSAKLQGLFDDLRTMYDYIIIDSPPTLLVTDSLIITNKVDTTLFIVNQTLSKKQEVKSAIRLLRENNANISGIIVTGKPNKIVQKYYQAY